jgi:hypothetical protein
MWPDKLCSVPLVEAWVRVECARPEVVDVLWRPAQFRSRLASMREMLAFYRRKGRDMRELKLAYPPSLDPFYDTSKEVLIGECNAGNCCLDRKTGPSLRQAIVAQARASAT